MTPPHPPDVVVYWRPGCPFCAALKLRLRLARIPFSAIDIWQNQDARDLVRSHNAGDDLVPTVQIGTTFLSNPGLRQVRAARRR